LHVKLFGKETSMARFHLTRRDALAIVAAAVIATIAAPPNVLPARAAIDSYMTFEGGPAAVQIDSFSFGADRGTGSAAGGAGSGKTTHQPVTITRTVDKSSPALFQAFTAGQHFSKLKIVFAGKTYVFDDVVVSGITTQSGDESPKETVTFVYGTLEIAGGAPAAPAPQVHTVPINPVNLAPVPIPSKKP
jgi:type VI secretion system secreted protein Hcp